MRFLRHNKKVLNTKVFNKADFSVLNYEQLLKVNGAGGSSGGGGNSGSSSGPSSSSSSSGTSSSSSSSASDSPSGSSSGGKGNSQTSPSSNAENQSTSNSITSGNFVNTTNSTPSLADTKNGVSVPIGTSWDDVGQSVLAGEKIGEVGSSGKSTGSHLHLGYDGNGDGIYSRTDKADDPSRLLYGEAY